MTRDTSGLLCAADQPTLDNVTTDSGSHRCSPPHRDRVADPEPDEELSASLWGDLERPPVGVRRLPGLPPLIFEMLVECAHITKRRTPDEPPSTVTARSAGYPISPSLNPTGSRRP